MLGEINRGAIRVCAWVEGGRVCMDVVVAVKDRMKIVIIIFVPVNVLYDKSYCVILYVLIHP